MKEVNYNNLPQAIEDLNDKLIDIKNLLIVQGRDPANKSDIQFTVSELADYLHLAKQTIYALVSRREIPHTKRGKLYFLKSEIDAYLLEGKRKTVNELRSEI